MAQTIKPGDLRKVIQRELTGYHERVVERVDEAGRTSMQDLVKLTKATAPKLTGGLKRRITMTERDNGLRGRTFTWHVRSPDHRIVHLVVHGHATVNGGRVPGNPFLHKAWAKVQPEYERKVEEAIKDA